jgi:hypothetical protein
MTSLTRLERLASSSQLRRVALSTLLERLLSDSPASPDAPRRPTADTRYGVSTCARRRP